MMAVYLGALGLMYADERGNFRKGIQYLEEGKQIFESLREWDDVAAVCNNLAGCFEIGMRDLALAAKYMGIAASVASATNPMKREYQARAADMQKRLKGIGFA